MATDVPKFGDVLNSDEEDDSHVGILHSTAIGDLSGSDLAHDFSVDEDQELEAIRARVRELEEEAEKIRAMQNDVDKQMSVGLSSFDGQVSDSESGEDQLDTDARSIWIGNVDYGTTAEELEAHFNGCGPVNRVTILCDKFSGRPKGFAYLEFSDRDSIETALALNDSLFRGRLIKVLSKRTNRPGMSTTNHPPRGRFFRFGSSRASFCRGGYNPRFGRSRGRHWPRRAWHYSPY